MPTKFISKRNLEFLLYEVLDTEQLIAYPYYADHNRKTFDMVMDAALKLAQKLLRPTLEEMDRNPPALIDQSYFSTFEKQTVEGFQMGHRFHNQTGIFRHLIPSG